MGTTRDDGDQSPFELPDEVAGLPSRLPEAQRTEARAEDEANPGGGAGWISGMPETDAPGGSDGAAAGEEPAIPTDLYLDAPPPAHDALADSSDLVVNTAIGGHTDAPDTPSPGCELEP